MAVMNLVARLDVANDPTLRSGDIVTIDGGFAAYTGSKSARGRMRTSCRSPIFRRLERHAPKTFGTRLPVRRTVAAPAIAPNENKSASRFDRRAQLLR
jgi:hypothetical protein